MKLIKNESLSGSTLPEMLVLLVLTGIILMAVFDGLSLFEGLRRKVIRGAEKGIAEISGYYRMEELFSLADSVVGIRDTMSFYRRGVKLAEMVVSDSVLTVSKGVAYDTLFTDIVYCEAVPNRYSPALADSLFVTRSSMQLKFWIKYDPGLTAVWETALYENGE